MKSMVFWVIIRRVVRREADVSEEHVDLEDGAVCSSEMSRSLLTKRFILSVVIHMENHLVKSTICLIVFYCEFALLKIDKLFKRHFPIAE
jgi:hypothetical protein